LEDDEGQEMRKIEENNGWKLEGNQRRKECKFYKRQAIKMNKSLNYLQAVPLVIQSK